VTEGARAVTFLFPDEPLVCTAGHAIEADFWVLGDTLYLMGGARCDFVAPVQPGDHLLSSKEVRQYRCGRTIWFAVLPQRYTVVADVAPKELHTMHRERMSFARCREYLGLDWRKRCTAPGPRGGSVPTPGAAV